MYTILYVCYITGYETLCGVLVCIGLEKPILDISDGESPQMEEFCCSLWQHIHKWKIFLLSYRMLVYYRIDL